jgi:hypothetical protein
VHNHLGSNSIPILLSGPHLKRYAARDRSGFKRVGRYTGWFFNTFEFMLCSPAQLLYTLNEKRQSISCYSRCSFFVLFFLPSSYALFHTFISERDCTPLHRLYKGWIQSNQQLALNRLMHWIHCGSATCSYQALGRRPAQETLTGCVGRMTWIRMHWTFVLYRILGFPVLFCVPGLFDALNTTLTL